MNRSALFVAAAAAAAAAVCAAPLDAADYPKSADHPALKRVTGSRIYFTKKQDFDELTLALEKLEWVAHEAVQKPFRSVTAEGRRQTNWYVCPAGMSVLEVWRNYEQELREQGFEILFSARGEDAETLSYNNRIAMDVLKIRSAYGTPEESANWPFYSNPDRDAAYIAARKAGEGGEIFASVYVIFNTQPLRSGGHDVPADVALARVDICEVKKREQRMSLVTSEEMKSEISLNGRVALYGIEFDFNSAEIRPESEAALAEILKLLRESPELRILVVGHTDAVGSFEYNRGLSQRRAEAVARYLAGKGVARERLFPVGVSFAAPVATNATEEGRAKNRRVELVDMAGAKAD